MKAERRDGIDDADGVESVLEGLEHVATVLEDAVIGPFTFDVSYGRLTFEVVVHQATAPSACVTGQFDWQPAVRCNDYVEISRKLELSAILFFRLDLVAPGERLDHRSTVVAQVIRLYVLAHSESFALQSVRFESTIELVRSKISHFFGAN